MFDLRYEYLIDKNKDLELAKVEFVKILEDLKHHKIPETYPPHIIYRNYIGGISEDLRYDIINEQGFALISKDWVSLLAKWIGSRKCVELMAGCGSLSYALQEEGVDIIATDKFTWNGDFGSWNTTKNYWTSIEHIDCIDAVEKYSDVDIFIISWAYMDDTAYRTLLKIRQVNPNALIIYIGESEGGCTANIDFYNTMIKIEDDSRFNEVSNLFKSWGGVYDELILIK